MQSSTIENSHRDGLDVEAVVAYDENSEQLKNGDFGGTPRRIQSTSNPAERFDSFNLVAEKAGNITDLPNLDLKSPATSTSANIGDEQT